MTIEEAAERQARTMYDEQQMKMKAEAAYLREQQQAHNDIGQCGSVQGAMAQESWANATPRTRGYEFVECLSQLAGGPVWDGNLIDKSIRDQLHKAGLIDRSCGWNFITAKGVEYCVTLGILRA